jgi:hypothetical protein
MGVVDGYGKSDVHVVASCVLVPELTGKNRGLSLLCSGNYLSVEYFPGFIVPVGCSSTFNTAVMSVRGSCPLMTVEAA